MISTHKHIIGARLHENDFPKKAQFKLSIELRLNVIKVELTKVKSLNNDKEKHANNMVELILTINTNTKTTIFLKLLFNLKSLGLPLLSLEWSAGRTPSAPVCLLNHAGHPRFRV